MQKQIRDLVYGYVELDERLLSLIDTGLFQRLKRIRQLTSQGIFPSTNHTRFEHSLGVLALGRRAFEAIQRNSEPEVAKAVLEFQPTLEAALLLHDIGHAPLSHVGERFYVTSEINGALAESETHLTADCAPHEAMSALICGSCLREQLERMGVDLDLLCRMVTGQPYTENEWAKNALISLVNSPCDVDKLDYVVRDNFMTGGQLASFDHERLASAYVLNQRTLALLPRAHSAIVNMVHGRNHMYQWVYNHHTTVYTDNRVLEYMKHLIGIEALQAGEVFSFEAVTDSLTDDSDAVTAMKRLRHSDERSKALFGQVFERKQHTPLWKTWYQFKERFSDDDAQRDRVLALGSRPEALGKNLRSSAGLEAEDALFAAEAVYKPYTPIGTKHIYIAAGTGNKQFSEFYETKVTKDLPGEIPYVFFDPKAVDRAAVIKALKAL